MERRAFIWKFGAVPLATCLSFNDKILSAAAKFERGYYLLFVDARVVDLHALASNPGVPGLPGDCFIEIVPLKLQDGQSIDDAVRLYKVQSTSVRP